MSLGVDKNKQGQWIDNVKNENNHSTTIYLHNLNGDVFNTNKMKEISIKYNNKNLDNMSNKISELSDNIKQIVLEII